MNGNSNVYHAGNTVRLQCTFEDFDGTRVNPEVIKITFYDTKYNILDEIILGAGNLIETGIYAYNFKTSKEVEKRYIYEWYGEINGLPSIKRSSFRTTFI